MRETEHDTTFKASKKPASDKVKLTGIVCRQVNKFAKQWSLTKGIA